MRSGARWSLQVAGAAVAAAAVVVPAQVAHAATGTTVGSFQHNQIVYSAGDGQQNKPTVTFSGGEIVVTDTVPLTIPSNATPNCRAVPGNALQVRCSLTNIHTMSILLGDRDDNANIASFPVTLALSVTGDDGNDTILGPASASDISAWTTYSGGAGNDTLRGGGRPESLFGDGGADLMAGGGGIDAVSYQYSPEPVSADADAVFGGVGYDRCFAGAGGARYFTCEVAA